MQHADPPSDAPSTIQEISSGAVTLALRTRGESA